MARDKTGHCEVCDFFVSHYDIEPPDRNEGSCHRHAPRPVLNVQLMMAKLLADLHWEKIGAETGLTRGMDFDDDSSLKPEWPVVDINDFCAELVRKECKPK